MPTAKLVWVSVSSTRREVVLKLVEAFRTNDDRGHHGFATAMIETRADYSVCFCDRSDHVEDLPGRSLSRWERSYSVRRESAGF